MKLIAFAVILVVAVAAPQFIQTASPPFKSEIRILTQKFIMDKQGNYEYGYKQSNGQIVKEVGRVEPGPEPETGYLTQQGEFQFIGEDGQTYQVSYVADVNGFQPQAAHLPQAPAQIPEYAQLRIEHPELFWAERLQFV